MSGRRNRPALLHAVILKLKSVFTLVDRVGAEQDPRHQSPGKEQNARNRNQHRRLASALRVLGSELDCPSKQAQASRHAKQPHCDFERQLEDL